MAKAIYQRNQKVWVESVGAWSVVEKIVPVWARGFDEPVRVTYDVGLGRDFQAHELKAEQDSDETLADDGSRWRLLRAKNKWQTEDNCRHHPYPGSYPVVVTDQNDWGGWRVPGAEYDRDPAKIEQQARLIASAPRLMEACRRVVAMVDGSPGQAPPEMVRLAEDIMKIEAYLKAVPAAEASEADPAAHAAE